MVAGLTNGELIAPMTYEEMMTSDFFEAWFQKFLLPTLTTPSVIRINQETLDKHHQSKTMQKILDLRKKYHLQMQVERYIEDDSGMPESDKSFIDTGN
ncbi:antibiotic biosynthesis monooxygenase subfamily protein [Streptococcus pneumoniae]|nr:antibiotic biosynthesis monooxygenase subfamily protein [Streptococcus pneumoniae]